MSRRAHWPEFARRTLCVVFVAATGCGTDSEFVQRYEAEGERWHVDHEEARLRSLHSDFDPELVERLC